MTARALVVDDDRASAALAAKMLQRLGWEATMCTEPEEVPARALSGDHDLVCLDLGMPRLDGYDVLMLIRSHEHTRRRANVPVIAVTGRTSPQDRAQVLAGGFSAHLAKPLTFDAMRRVLEQVPRLQSTLTAALGGTDPITAVARAFDRHGQGDRLTSKAGLALAVEEQGQRLLSVALLRAFSAHMDEAAVAVGGIVSLASAIGATGLRVAAERLHDHLRVGGSELELAAVLARAELDRVGTILRREVLV